MSIDLSQLKELSINGIELNTLFIGNYKNLVPSSIDSDGSLFGYVEGYRLNSSAGLVEQEKAVTTGYIPCTASSVIRMSGPTWLTGGIAGSYSYVHYYNNDFQSLGCINGRFEYKNGGNVIAEFAGGGIVDFSNHNITTDINGITTLDVPFTSGSDTSQIAYCRITGVGFGRNMVITVDEEIVNAQMWTRITYKNWVKYSTESDGKTIYNGGLGYKNGYRLRSGGAEGENHQSAHTGFIPVNGGDVIRISGMNFENTNAHASAINVANSSFENIGQCSDSSGDYGIFTQSAYNSYGRKAILNAKEKEGVWKWTVPPAASGVAYVRISCGSIVVGTDADGSTLIVTINEEIN